MIDWWLALILSLTAGGFTLAAVALTHALTTQSTRDADEQRAAQRIAEEDRHAARELRRERVQPILDFMALAKDFTSKYTLFRSLQAAIDKLDVDESRRGALRTRVWTALEKRRRA